PDAKWELDKYLRFHRSNTGAGRLHYPLIALFSRTKLGPISAKQSIREQTTDRHSISFQINRIVYLCVPESQFFKLPELVISHIQVR
ncbi:MAG: hypothetical protein KDK34_03725, partial [Leptospiraceae bacterium]|nr:hypothetical protein [Leptospiraceae bacterium]